MSKIKIMLFSALATVALSAIMSSSALAAHEFKVEGTAVGATPFEVQGVSQEGWLEGVAAEKGIAITCQGDYTSIEAKANQIEKEGKSKAKIEFRNCFVYKIETGGRKVATECKIVEPITAEATDELIGVGEDKFTGSKAAEGFTEFEIKKSEAGATCAYTTVSSLKIPVKGFELCTVPLAFEENVVHELFCTPGGSKLVVGTEPARLFSTELLKLIKAEKWSAT